MDKTITWVLIGLFLAIPSAILAYQGTIPLLKRALHMESREQTSTFQPPPENPSSQLVCLRFLRDFLLLGTDKTVSRISEKNIHVALANEVKEGAQSLVFRFIYRRRWLGTKKGAYRGSGKQMKIVLLDDCSFVSPHSSTLQFCSLPNGSTTDDDPERMKVIPEQPKGINDLLKIFSLRSDAITYLDSESGAKPGVEPGVKPGSGFVLCW